jgi:hypothetical protein
MRKMPTKNKNSIAGMRPPPRRAIADHVVTDALALTDEALAAALVRARTLEVDTLAAGVADVEAVLLGHDTAHLTPVYVTL